MAYELPPAPKKYNQPNESQSRRLIDQAFSELYARLVRLEADAAGGGTPAVGPTAAFTVETFGLVASFTDASTPGDAPNIVARLWDFGDGEQSTAPNNLSPDHTYAAAGTYTVTLTVTDEDGLSDVSDPVEVAVTSLGAPVFFVRGVNSVSQLTTYPWWNGGQIGGMTPSDCMTLINGFRNAGKHCAVRLYNDAGSKVNGVFNVEAWKTSIRRYADAGLTDFLNAAAQDGTITYFDLIDDITSGNRWGREITKAEIEEMAAYSRSLYFALPVWARARTTQLEGFNYSSLQGCSSIYLFGRGGVAQGGMTEQEWRIADCEAYLATEQAARNAIEAASGINLSASFGLNIVNGGDGTSGIPGDGSPADRWRMSAQEIRDYADILVPASEGTFQMWEWAADGSGDSYLARSDIQASMNYVRNICDVQ